jgi:hypothetical protein
VPEKLGVPSRSADSDEASLHEKLPQSPTGHSSHDFDRQAAPRKICAQVDRETELNIEMETPVKAVSSSRVTLVHVIELSLLH